MYQKIAEEIIVAGSYKQAFFWPKKFSWRKRIYLIDEITLTSNYQDDGVKKRLYSVLAQHNLFRLEFNRETEKWQLLAIYCE